MQCMNAPNDSKTLNEPLNHRTNLKTKLFYTLNSKIFELIKFIKFTIIDHSSIKIFDSWVGWIRVLNDVSVGASINLLFFVVWNRSCRVHRNSNLLVHNTMPLSSLKLSPCFSIHVIKGNEKLVMWWGVTKSEEFVDLEMPPKRIFTFEFRLLDRFVLGYRRFNHLRSIAMIQIIRNTNGFNVPRCWNSILGEWISRIWYVKVERERELLVNLYLKKKGKHKRNFPTWKKFIIRKHDIKWGITCLYLCGHNKGVTT